MSDVESRHVLKWQETRSIKFKQQYPECVFLLHSHWSQIALIKTLIHTVRWKMAVKRDVLKSSSLSKPDIRWLSQIHTELNKWPSCYHSGISHKSLNTAVQETNNHAHRTGKHFFLKCRVTETKHCTNTCGNVFVCWFVMFPIKCIP